MSLDDISNGVLLVPHPVEIIGHHVGPVGILQHAGDIKPPEIPVGTGDGKGQAVGAVGGPVECLSERLEEEDVVLGVFFMATSVAGSGVSVGARMSILYLWKRKVGVSEGTTYSQSKSTPSNPYFFMKSTRLLANVCRLVSVLAMSPNVGCVAVSLSLNVHPPSETNTARSDKPVLKVLTSAVCVNSEEGVSPSMGTISNDFGSIYPKAKFRCVSP